MKIVTKTVTWYSTEIILVMSKKLLFNFHVYFPDEKRGMGGMELFGDIAN